MDCNSFVADEIDLMEDFRKEYSQKHAAQPGAFPSELPKDEWRTKFAVYRILRETRESISGK